VIMFSITKQCLSKQGPTRPQPKLLIVDDDPAMREFLTDFCAINGFPVDIASSGERALDIVGGGKSHCLAIIDFLMPEMNGVDLLKELKKINPDLPVIAMSAMGSVETAFMDAGAYLFLQKPFDPYCLEKEVEAVIAATAERHETCSTAKKQTQTTSPPAL
jgi:DNA-binding NtrC family response regulator